MTFENPWKYNESWKPLGLCPSGKEREYPVGSPLNLPDREGLLNCPWSSYGYSPCHSPERKGPRVKATLALRPGQTGCLTWIVLSCLQMLSKEVLSGFSRRCFILVSQDKWRLFSTCIPQAPQGFSGLSQGVGEMNWDAQLKSWPSGSVVHDSGPRDAGVPIFVDPTLSTPSGIQGPQEPHKAILRGPYMARSCVILFVLPSQAPGLTTDLWK